MAIDTPSNNALFKTEFIQTRMTNFVSKGIPILPFLNRQETDADLYIHYVEEKTAEQAIADGTIKEPQEVEPGSELTVIRDSALKGKKEQVKTLGFKYIVSNKKIAQNGMSILRNMQRQAYAIGREIHGDLISSLIAGAAADTITLNGGGWDSSAKIDEDIIDMQEAFFDPSLPSVLNGLFYNQTNLTQVKKFKRITEGPGDGFGDVQSLDWLGAKHQYGGFQIPVNTVLGWDTDLPPASVVWGTEEGTTQPNVMPGMEAFAPLVNVLVKDVTDELPHKKVIYMLTNYTTAIEERNALLSQSVAGA